MLVGLGDIARKRVGAALAAQPQSRLRACVTRDPTARVAELDRLQPQRVYSNLSEALADEAIDAVYLATPVHLHAPQTIAALEAGKHVLVEKPMALDAHQAEQMIAAADRCGRHLAVAYYRRFWPSFERVRQMLRRNELGQLVLVRLTLQSWYAPAADDPKAWRVRPEESGGGVLLDVGSHRLDLLAWWLGLPRRLVSEVRTRTHGYGVEDSVAALLTFADEVPCAASFHWNSKAWADEIHVVGTDASVALTPTDSDQLTITRGSETEQVKLPKPDNLHYPLIDDFASAIARQQSPRFNGVDGSAATRIIDAIVQSARSKAWVQI